MNERIDEIAFEAGCHRHKYWDPKHPDLEGFIISQATLDKFAQLIIKKCILMCETQEYHYWRSPEDQEFTPIDCADAIKKHFGVE